ncbi:hypothetical protein AAC03nite_34960 [Alicyclobacillus acidoterrestris]|nr:hypothetical protein N007_11240 [Alicyclobacillus acidoterrestris ATCC 49025]GEO27711.1 hypothetical protein AAC03nite_34960 [Alicyclobacillus acidoterrestris]
MLFFIIIAVIANVTGTFYLGSFTGIHLKNQQKFTVEDQSIKNTYTNVANEWKNGLDTQQQNIVITYQQYMPASVLLTLGKFVDNYKSKNQQSAAQSYYNLLAPKYTWVKGDGETITKERDSNGIVTHISHFTVWELRKSVIWDGTFTSTWGTKTIGGFTNGVGTETIEPYMESENMTYNESEFYAAAKKYGFKQSVVNPLWFDAIYSMQYAEYQAGDQNANLNDPNVQQWGPIFGNSAPVVPPVPVGAGTVANKAQVEQWVNEAIALDAPYGITSSWMPTIMQIIAIEDASGNPYAENPILVMGQHATGIMQTLPSTFQEFEVPGHTNIFNPVDNIAAAMRYILKEYGDPAKALAEEANGGY